MPSEDSELLEFFGPTEKSPGPWGHVQRQQVSTHGVIEEFAKLNNLDGATVKVWFNNKRQRDTGEPSEP